MDIGQIVDDQIEMKMMSNLKQKISDKKKNINTSKIGLILGRCSSESGLATPYLINCENFVFSNLDLVEL